MGKPFIPWRVFYLLVALLVSSQAQTASPGPNAFENVCEEAGSSDNLACETEDDFMVCFPRAELCSGTAFCRDGADEGSTTKTGLDCDGSFTGRKPDETGGMQPGFLCLNGSIIDIDQMCDGTAHCAGGDDETDYLCANKCLAPYYGGCPYTRECTSTLETATCGNCRPGFARNPSNFTIGECVDATIRFCSTVYIRCEGHAAYPYICLNTAGVLDQAVTFNISTVDGTATAGEDYVPYSAEVIVFTEGHSSSTRGFKWLQTLRDNVTEDSETFDVVASAGDWSFTTGRDRATVIINECVDHLVTVMSHSYVTEGPDAVLTTTIQLASGVGTLQEDVVVDVTTSGHTGNNGATGDVDYVETNSTITFTNGTEGGTTMEFSVPIINDNIAEYREIFTITAMVHGNGIGLFNRLSHSGRVYIKDNDFFKVAFEHREYTVMEGDVAEVCLVGVTTPTRVHPFTVYIHTTHDFDNTTKDTTADLDYEALYESIQVLFPPESNRECVTIQTYHDGIAEPPEKFLLWAYGTSGLGQLSQYQRTASMIIQSVNIDPVTVSIEESSYTVTEPENMEVCVRAEGRLEQSVIILLESLNPSQSKNATLSPSVPCTCATFNFSISGITVIIQATVLSSSKRITSGCSITELFLLGSDNPDQCPSLLHPPNGQVEQSLSDGLLSPGSVATYSCDLGFVPKGTRFRMCMEDFTWSGELPRCEQETMGELISLCNELILGFSTSSPFGIITTADTEVVHSVATGESFSYSRSRDNQGYRSFFVSSRAKDIHIKADVGKKVTVYGWEQFYTSPFYQLDAFLAFSIANSVNTYEYYSIPYNHTNSLLIVAQEDDTVVTLPSSTIVLDRFQTYQIQDISPRTTTRLESNQPLSVTSAKTCSQSDCDYLVEQVLPTHLWGRTFLVASFSGPKTGESVRVIASEQSTDLNITCTETDFYRNFSDLDAGHWIDIEIDQHGKDVFCIVEASAPVYTLQYAEESVGGSYMMTIPAIEQYGTSFTGFYTPNGSPSNYITVYVTPQHFVPLAISVDGTPVQDWTRVRCSDGTTCGYIARPTLRRSTYYHTVHHVDPRARLGFSAYGFDLTRRTSYGYPGSLEIPSPQNIDECLPEVESQVCGPNSVCINPNGYYECKAICSDLPTLVNAMLIKYSPNTTPRLEGTVATHRCDFGYELSGGAVRTCQSNSTWSGESITCEALDCGPPTVPSNGQVTLLSGTTTLNSLATYSCDSCYELEGASTRICVGDGQWLPTVPSCQIISDCGRPASILNGNVHTSPKTECGSVATYSCDSGYELEGESEHTCQPDGRWSGDQPVCTPVNCGRLIAPTNGQVATPSGTSFRRVATYSCNRGYRIVGTSSRTCEPEGQWGPGSAPTCEPVDYGPLSNLANGEVDSSSGTTFGRVATYSCDTCYDLVGGRSRTCTASGVWSPAAPSCQIVDCGSLVTPENGLVNTVSGTTCPQQATYSCLEGYVLNGISSRNCATSGQWTLSAPTCPPVDCGTLMAPANGQVVTPSGTTFGRVATYSCSRGYTVVGSMSRTCNADRQWRPIAPTCEPVDCGPLPNPTNGEVDSSSGTTFRRVATYSCDTCYDLVGGRSRTCTASGVWSPAAPSCQIVDCGSLVNPENGLVSTQSGTTCSQQATYSCLEGHILIGSQTRTCTASRQWTLSAPTCPPVNCGELHTPSNGHVETSNGTLFQSTATFSCDPGYNLTGCAVAECLSNGSWSCKPPFCADNALIQLKISPARRCDEWTEKKVDLMYYVMYSSIQKAIQGSGYVIPKENIQRGYFSCYQSESESTY